MIRLKHLVTEAAPKTDPMNAKALAKVKSFLTKVSKIAMELETLEDEMATPGFMNYYALTSAQAGAFGDLRDLVGGAADMLNKGLSAKKFGIREGKRPLVEARNAQAVSVWVFYPGSLYGTDKGEALEKTISATAKKFGMKEEGSGLGGDRDLSFFSKDPAKAKAFAAAAKKLAGVKKVEVYDDLHEAKRPLREARYPCECSDPGCPVCKGKCRKPSTMTLYRIDMEDSDGTPMCQGCGDDAMESGVFTTEK